MARYKRLDNCKNCGIEFTEYNSVWSGPNKRQNLCKECWLQYKRDYYKTHYSSRNGISEHIINSPLKRYGITVEKYNELLMSQLYGCAVCGLPCSTGDRLAVDHDHETNEIRGLLCNSCNTALGHLKENQWNAERLLEYMKKYGINRDIKSKAE